MYLANSQQVSFKDLAGLSFVVLNDIGPWKEIIQKYIPNAKFLYHVVCKIKLEKIKSHL